VKAAGAPKGLRVHDLRHHAATETARSGATTKELMARIGHSTPRAALIYQHATEERDRAVADYLDEKIAGVDRTAKAPVAEIEKSAGYSRDGGRGRKPRRTSGTPNNQVKQVEAAGGIEPPYGALQAPA
jgi:Phage integrase family